MCGRFLLLTLQRKGCLRCRFGKNLGAQGEKKFPSLILHINLSMIINCLFIFGGRRIDRKMFETQKISSYGS